MGREGWNKPVVGVDGEGVRRGASRSSPRDVSKLIGELDRSAGNVSLGGREGRVHEPVDEAGEDLDVAELGALPTGSESP